MNFSWEIQKFEAFFFYGQSKNNSDGFESEKDCVVVVEIRIIFRFNLIIMSNKE